MLKIVNAVRQNHALEHATMHLLSQRNPYLQLVGRSTATGFIIYGSLTAQEVAAAASEALVRLQQGESHLAFHPRCGTNLAVTGILAGTAAYGATLGGRSRSKLDRLPLALMASVLAVIVAQPISQTVQQRITTTPDVEDVYIVEVVRHELGRAVAHKVVIERG